MTETWLKQRNIIYKRFDLVYTFIVPVTLENLFHACDKQGIKVIDYDRVLRIVFRDIYIVISRRGITVTKPKPPMIYLLKRKRLSLNLFNISITPIDLLTQLFEALHIEQPIMHDNMSITVYATSRYNTMMHYLPTIHKINSNDNYLKHEHPVTHWEAPSLNYLRQFYQSIYCQCLLPHILQVLFYLSTSYFFLLPEEIKHVILQCYQHQSLVVTFRDDV